MTSARSMLALAHLLVVVAILGAGGCSGSGAEGAGAHAAAERHDPAAFDGGSCYACHGPVRDVMTVSRRVHAPAGRDCLICHEVHGDDPSVAIRRPIADGCFRCHADIETIVGGAQTPHGAVTTQDECSNCHDPHASSQVSLLRDHQEAVCLQCHDQAVQATDGRTIPDMAPAVRDREFIHGPVRSGSCTTCHNVHGASQSRLLTQRFTESFYSSFDLKNYALCFECHDAGLVKDERTTVSTTFRDGDRNLHYVHVHQEKGRTCRACHELHGSALPSQVAESVPFEGSGWALPIGFRPTASGGSCAPGCHVPMSYDRGIEP